MAAMRPQLCRVGGAIADGVLLNWMLPAQAAQARQWVRRERLRQDAPRPSLHHMFG